MTAKLATDVRLEELDSAHELVGQGPALSFVLRERKLGDEEDTVRLQRLIGTRHDGLFVARLVKRRVDQGHVVTTLEAHGLEGRTDKVPASHAWLAHNPLRDVKPAR
jgi:hypothetical protein